MVYRKEGEEEEGEDEEGEEEEGDEEEGEAEGKCLEPDKSKIIGYR